MSMLGGGRLRRRSLSIDWREWDDPSSAFGTFSPLRRGEGYIRLARYQFVTSVSGVFVPGAGS